jgi:2-oxoglutarate ferredoxin oxidoreductase subunit beta
MNHEKFKKNLKQLEKNADIYAAYECGEKLTWCSGCGNYSIQNALRAALSMEEIENHQVVGCFDVGCNGNGSDKMNMYTIHGLHGRVISLAAGVAVANPELCVVASAGDGATYSEGVNHLVHAIRNDYKMLFIQHNNGLYALTTGQASALSTKNAILNSSPDGVYLDPIDTLRFVLSLKPSFMARTFSGDVQHMTDILRAGLNHNGFAFVEVLQVCPTYNKAASQKWFWENIAYLEDLPEYDKHDISHAWRVLENQEKLLVGIFHQNPQSSFLEKLPNQASRNQKCVDEVVNFNVEEFLTELI